MADAAVLNGIGDGNIESVITYLLCQWANVPVVPPIHNITNGLVNWWKFDENSGLTAADSSDAANGTLSGASKPTWIPGIINSATNFNGTSSFIQLATNTSAGTGAFSVTCWVKTGASGGTIIYDSDNDSSAGFWFIVNVVTIVNIVGTVADLIAETGPNPIINVGEWTHVAFTWTGDLTDYTSVITYINAVQYDQNGPSSNGSGNHGSNTTTDRWIGQSNGASFFDGGIDDLRIYNRVLTPAEISMIYQWRGQP